MKIMHYRAYILTSSNVHKIKDDDDALIKAIEFVRSTVRLSDRHRVDSEKVQENKAAQLKKASESE